MDPEAFEPVFLQTYPDFLKKLPEDPAGAFEEFAILAWRYLDKRCDAMFRGIDADHRTNLMTDTILYFRSQDYGPLRAYRDQDIPFFPGYFRKKVKWKLADYWNGVSNASKYTLEDIDNVPNLPSKNKWIADVVADRDLCRRVERVLDEIGRECKILVLAKYRDGYSNIDLPGLIGWPPHKNKEIGTKVERCLTRLVKTLRDLGLM